MESAFVSDAKILNMKEWLAFFSVTIRSFIWRFKRKKVFEETWKQTYNKQAEKKIIWARGDWQTLAEIDSDNAETYQQNAEAYVAQLDLLC